jgi:pilus assembly protein CpaE
MADNKALLQDDLGTDFEDVFGDTAGANPADMLDPVALDTIGDTEASLLEAPSKLVEFNSPVFGMVEQGGGDAVLPAISIKVFYEREETHHLMATCARDRRLGRATVDIIPGGLAAAIQHLSENPTPNLLILESSAHSARIIEEVDELAGHCDEHVKVMVIGTVNDIALYRQLVSRGVSEYVVPPLRPLQIIRSIGNLFADPDAPFIGKQISVIGAKGGVGASTVAHNLAWSLAENIGLNTTLVDLDLSFGTTALDFNQDMPQTVADALLAPERADDAVIERLLARATERLSLFTAPATISQIMDIPDDAYATVISTVRRNVPFMVLDLPHAWSSWVRATLIASDEVIVVCQPDLASLRNGKNLIDQLKGHRSNDHPPRLVLNMVGVPKRPEIPVKDFAHAIGVEPEATILFEPEIFGTAANNGQMISETDAASKSAMAIDSLATAISGRAVQKQQKTLFQKLLGK